MINLRYHIVSIVAVFLALGVGILLGSAVLSGALIDRLESDISTARTQRNEAQDRADTLESDLNRSGDLIEALGPRVTGGVLVGTRVVFVSGETEPDWHAKVRKAITDAGAEDVGSIELTSKWALEKEADGDELVEAFGDVTISTAVPSDDGALRLGELLPGLSEDLLSRLSDAGFVRAAPADPDTSFPPTGVQVVVLGSPDQVPLSSLAVGASRVTGTLAAAGDVENLGPVGTLRERDDATARLATFDSADADPAGVGTVLALRAATDNTGGHFGRAPGLTYLPAPP